MEMCVCTVAGTTHKNHRASPRAPGSAIVQPPPRRIHALVNLCRAPALCRAGDMARDSQCRGAVDGFRAHLFSCPAEKMVGLHRGRAERGAASHFRRFISTSTIIPHSNDKFLPPILSPLPDPIFLHRLDLMFGREDRKSFYRHRSLGHGTFPGQIQPPPITSAGPCRNDGWRSADQVPRHLFVQGDPVSGWVHGPKDDVFEDRVRFLFPGL